MPVNLTSNSTYIQNFNSLANSGTSSTLPIGWEILETGTSANANGSYTAGTGSSNAGDTYSFGSAGSTERALGGLQSGTLVPTIGASFTNNTGAVITAFNIAYSGEQWRLGTSGRADRLDFQYSADATSLATGTWFDLDTLDFVSPTTTGTVGLLDGNAAANRTNISGGISGLSLNSGSTFWIRWNSFDATGADDGLAIDDFAITPVVTSPAAGLTITQSDNTTSVTEGGASDSYTVVLNTQPTADVVVAIANPGTLAQLALTPTTLTFTAANWNTPQTVTVTAVDDNAVEGLHSSQITTAVSSADSSYNGLAVAPLNVSIVDNDVTVTKIHSIQGNGTTFNSAFGGTQTIEGVVVGAFGGTGKLNGFYVQEEDADADTDATTSEGIFVFDPNGLFSGVVGTKVRLTGTVGEFTTSSTGIAGSASSSLTQISLSNTSLSSVVNLGAVALPTVTNVVLPIADAAVLERYEGMLVNVSSNNSPLVVTETFKLGRFGQVGLSGGARLDQFTQVNAPSVSGYSNYLANLQDNYIILDDGSTAQNPDPVIHARGGLPLSASNTLRGGDTISSISGVIDQRFEGYRIQSTTPANFNPTNAREATAPTVGGTLRVASANLLNFFNGNGLDANNDGLVDGGFPTARGANNAIEFKRQIDKTVQEVLGLNADIFGYNEMENDGFDSASAVQQLVNALNAATAPGTYAFVTPPSAALNATGGFGGDAITVGFIYKTSAARIAPGTSAAALTTGIFAQDDASRVQRPAMAVTFERLANGVATNETFTAVINHFKSKGSAAQLPGDADQGDGQGLSNATRTQAAQELAAWLASNPTGTTDTDYLIMGDLNAYRLEDPLNTLTNAGYTSLFGPESYSYQFNGQWGSLDHALASASLNSQVTGAAKWHINSDEPIVLDYNTEFKNANQVNSFYNVDPFRTSDHDPILVGLNLKANNQAPTAIGLVNPVSSIAENTNIAAGFKIADIAITDDGLGTNNLSLAGDDASFFEVIDSALYLKAGTLLDFETQNSYSITVAVDDNQVGNTPDATTNFVLSITNVNEAPVLQQPIADQVAGLNQPFSLVIPDTAFTDVDAGDTLTYSASLDNGSPLPSWLTFDPSSRTFTGTPPITSSGNILNIQVKAVDNAGAQAQDLFILTVGSRVVGTRRSDNLSGTSSNDQIFGLAGNDTILGGAGDDTIDGGAGIDFLDGGSGSDTYKILAAQGEFDLINDSGNGDIDVLKNIGNSAITLNQFLSSNGIEVVDGNNFAVLGNENANVLDFSTVNLQNVLYINGNNGNDTITGSAANDDLRGGAGNDTIYGGAGNDTIRGGTGNDYIDGGAGMDNLFGGAGADIFVIHRPTDGVDTINDFSAIQDRFNLSSGVNGFGDVLGEIGVLATSRFTSGSAATTNAHRLIYNNQSGELFFDADGNGSAFQQVQIAQLSNNPNLTANNFRIV